MEGFDSKKADDYQLKGIVNEKFVVWEYKPGKNANGMEGKNKSEQHKSSSKNASTLETDTQNNPKEKCGSVSDKRKLLFPFLNLFFKCHNSPKIRILNFLFLFFSVSFSIGNSTADISRKAVVRIVEVLYTGICFGGICNQYTGTRSFN